MGEKCEGRQSEKMGTVVGIHRQACRLQRRQSQIRGIDSHALDFPHPSPPPDLGPAALSTVVHGSKAALRSLFLSFYILPATTSSIRPFIPVPTRNQPKRTAAKKTRRTDKQALTVQNKNFPTLENKGIALHLSTKRSQQNRNNKKRGGLGHLRLATHPFTHTFGQSCRSQSRFQYITAYVNTKLQAHTCAIKPPSAPLSFFRALPLERVRVPVR